MASLRAVYYSAITLAMGVAIMGDDIVAGIYAGALLHLLHWRMRS